MSNMWKVAACLGFVLVALSACCLADSMSTRSESTPPDTRAQTEDKLVRAEDFGTGIDLRDVSHSSELPTPISLQLATDDTRGFLRVVTFVDDNGEKIELVVRADSHRNLILGPDNFPWVEPVPEERLHSNYSTSLGISLGASDAEVVANYGKANRRAYQQWPDIEFLDYESELEDSLVSILSFTLWRNKVVRIDSILYDPALMDEWSKSGRFYRDGQLVDPKAESSGEPETR